MWCFQFSIFNCLFLIVTLVKGAAVKQRISRVVLVAGLCNLSLLGCTESGAIVNEAPYYHQAQSAVLVQHDHYLMNQQYVGKVQSKQNAGLGFEQNGKIANLWVEVGDMVQAGDKLAGQDTALLAIEQRQLQAQQHQLQADLTLVDTNIRRLTALKLKDYASTRSLDELTAQQKGLAAGLERLAASVSGNQIKREKSILYAPFSGVIAAVYITDGEVIGAGRVVIKLLQQDSLEVKVGVPVDQLQAMNLQQHYQIMIQNQGYDAILFGKGLDVDPVSRTVQLRFGLLGTPPLVHGQLALLKLEQRIPQAGYWVPMTALTDGIRGMWQIYTLSGEADSELFTLHTRQVDILYSDKQRAYINGSIQAGERYLSAGLQRLAPGQQVRTSIDPSEQAL